MPRATTQAQPLNQCKSAAFSGLCQHPMQALLPNAAQRLLHTNGTPPHQIVSLEVLALVNAGSQPCVCMGNQGEQQLEAHRMRGRVARSLSG